MAASSTRTDEESLNHSHAAVKVHPVDTNGRVILDAQIDVFADPETEVARLREIPFPQLVFLDLQPSLQDLLSFRAPDGDVDGDLFVATDTERSDGVACFAFVVGCNCQLISSMMLFFRFRALRVRCRICDIL